MGAPPNLGKGLIASQVRVGHYGIRVIIGHLFLTGDDEGGVSGDLPSIVVGGLAPVDTGVVLLPGLNGSQEEEGPIREKHAVRFVVGGRCPHRETVFEPPDVRGGMAGRAAFQGDGLVLDDALVPRVLRDHGGREGRRGLT